MNFPRLLVRIFLVTSLFTLSGALASAQTVAAFTATLQADAGGALLLHWPSQSGQHYHVESSPDLTTWTAEPGTFTGTGGELTSVVRSGGATDPARQFWRVVADDAPPISVALLAHRTSGVAPLNVHFDATDTTATSTAQPFHDLEYRWDFGDPGSGAWANGSNSAASSKNRATGAVAAHVFETPGTYTVTLAITDGTNVTTRTQTITVSDANAVFAANTTCISTDGDFTGAPSGASRITNSDFDAALSAAFAAGARRILFKRGQAFLVGSSAFAPATGDAILIGAFGSGNRPIVRATADGIYGAIVVGFDTTDCRVMDLEFDGQSFATIAMRGVSANGPNTLVLRCYGHDLGMLAALGGDTLAVVDCESYNIVGGAHGVMSVWCGDGMKLNLSGNKLDNNNAGEYCFRYQGGKKGVVTHNTMRRCGVGKTLFTLRGDGTGTTPQNTYVTQFMSVTDNWFDGEFAATPMPVTISPQNSSRNEPIRDVLFERNYLSGVGGPVLWVIASKVSVRNNIFNMPASGGSAAVWVTYNTNLAGLPVPDGNMICNNTIISPFVGIGLSGVMILNQGAQPTNTIVKNNFCYAPYATRNGAGYGVPEALTDLGSGTVAAGNSTAAQVKTASPNISAFPPASWSDCALAPGCYGIDSGVAVPIWSDFAGNPLTAADPRSIGALAKTPPAAVSSLEFVSRLFEPDQIEQKNLSLGPGVLFTCWTKITTDETKPEFNPYPWGKRNDYPVTIEGANWSLIAVTGNTVTAGTYNANTMFAMDSDGYEGDHTIIIPWTSRAATIDWVFRAFQVVAAPDGMTIRQWIKLANKPLDFQEEIVPLATLRAHVVANCGGTWVTRAPTWVPSQNVTGITLGRRDSNSESFYLTQARIYQRTDAPTLAEITAIAANSQPDPTAWCDCALTWNGAPVLTDRSGHGHDLAIKSGGVLTQGPLFVRPAW